MRRLFECLCCLSAGTSFGLDATGLFPGATVDGLVLLAGLCLVNALEGGFDALDRYTRRMP